MTKRQYLRDVLNSDLDAFYAQQLDSEASLMAAFPSRSESEFKAHWIHKVLQNKMAVHKTIIVQDEIAGYIMSWKQEEKQLIGYWLGRPYWGTGVATRALQDFLNYLHIRPLFAYVANHNIGSTKVLLKCGFIPAATTMIFSVVHDRDIEETMFILN